MKEIKKVGGINDTDIIIQGEDKRLAEAEVAQEELGQNKLDPEYQAVKDSILETIKACSALLSCCCCWVVALRLNKFIVALANSRQLE
eukprot:1662044-Ditylum_brightwellii.AAC.1